MTRNADELLGNVMKLDPLHEAEKLTGKSYKEDKGTEALGVLLHMEHVRQKEELLRSSGDTTFTMALTNYLGIIEEEGFEPLLWIPFKGNNAKEDSFQIHWKASEGVLLAFDTYSGDTTVNGGNFYYCWKPHNRRGPWVTSSGAYKDGIWAGGHDCREGLRFHLRQLRYHGTFIVPWTHSPYPWLVHYKDVPTGLSFKESNPLYRNITRERLEALPKQVLEAIGGVSLNVR